MLRLLTDYWYVPVLVIAVALGFLWWFRRNPIDTIKRELGAIEAAREARAILISEGAEQAAAHVRGKYAAKRAALEAEEEARAAALERDPVALAKYLERLTR